VVLIFYLAGLPSFPFFPCLQEKNAKIKALGEARGILKHTRAIPFLEGIRILPRTFSWEQVSGAFQFSVMCLKK